MEVEPKNHGLIDVECFILETHKLILDEIPGKQGAIFSTKDRFGIVDNKVAHSHNYPKYDSEENVRCKAQMVIDQYNTLPEQITILYNENSENDIEKL